MTNQEQVSGGAVKDLDGVLATEVYPCGDCGHVGTETDGSIEAGSNCVNCGSRNTWASTICVGMDQYRIVGPAQVHIGDDWTVIPDGKRAYFLPNSFHPAANQHTGEPS